MQLAKPPDSLRPYFHVICTSVVVIQHTAAHAATLSDRAESILGFSVVDFSVYPDASGDPLRYVYLLEPDSIPDGLTRDMIADEINHHLCETNPLYDYKFEKGIFGRLEVRFVQPETYLLYRDLAISKGTASSQLKPPHILGNEIQRRFFLALLDEDR